MNERSDQRLSTADMVAATEGQRGQATSTSPTGANAPARDEKQAAALFSADETHRFRDRWDDVQTGFVDEPRRAVEQADQLVAEVMKRLAEIFAGERSKLEGQWSRGNDVSTEDLRLALRRYRSFFDRLLTYGGQGGDGTREQTGSQGMRPQADGARQRPAMSGQESLPSYQEATPSRPATGRWEDAMPRYRASWEQRFGSQGESWEADEPCYRYAWEMRQNPQYRDRPWPAAEPELRQDWEQRHPDTPWERVADKMRDAWESVVPASTR
ncbi:MAG TPA: hypothetical protein VII06_26640 [Chloroflexota bacterium]|jgi:hypothetical protein